MYHVTGPYVLANSIIYLASVLRRWKLEPPQRPPDAGNWGSLCDCVHWMDHWIEQWKGEPNPWAPPGFTGDALVKGSKRLPPGLAARTSISGEPYNPTNDPAYKWELWSIYNNKCVKSKKKVSSGHCEYIRRLIDECE